MGMEGKLRQVSEFELALFCEEPAKAYSGILNRQNSSDTQQLIEKMKALQSSPAMKRIQERAAAHLPPDNEERAAYLAEFKAILADHQKASIELQFPHVDLSNDSGVLSLHKSWHCLHFLLTGKSWDFIDSILGKAIMGGNKLPDRQGVMGYGPIRYLVPEEVRQVAQALEGFPIEERASAFDPAVAESAKVYVPDHDAEELTHYFFLLKEFYADAAAKNNAMLLWVE